MNSGFKFNDTVSLVLCGEAGSGIQTIDGALSHVFANLGYNVFSTMEFMSRIRGGSNSSSIRISSKSVTAPVHKIDILIPFDTQAVLHVRERITPSTCIICDETLIKPEGFSTINAPFSSLALEAGGKLFTNIIVGGLLLGLFDEGLDKLHEYLRNKYSKNPDPTFVQKNLLAAEKGFELGRNIKKSSGISISIQKDHSRGNQILLSGTEAVAMGALAGGCNFISSYPMSPSTDILTFLSKHADKFSTAVEQAEDEISAINMALGASYAGARAMVATSGGGFALMCEGVSLAGMIETPIVIHIGQRPGPATGLPTRTEQGDLELALYSGHGEFPRIIFAPGSLNEGFFMMSKAFEMADRYQIPVFVLTDQYFLDSGYNTELFELPETSKESNIIRTEADYKRFLLTDTGISPRGVPGYGGGMVCVDSDEHDEDAHITEDLALRVKMVDKRLRKMQSIAKDTIKPSLYGDPEYEILIVSWGSNLGNIAEAIDRIRNENGDLKIALLHYSQVYPLHSATHSYINKAKHTIIVENNATSQFGGLIKKETGLSFKHKILKYNGLPFMIDELEASIKMTIKRGGNAKK
ncbi:MAG: 2-oxoacid:acceptor oxidoreductase subunit alpha [Elusimicrobia bacterium]|nr:2-oxoacid:acceptor oxidoreductase subunit alpha [Candidatus Obscuribacterium magneticum]